MCLMNLAPREGKFLPGTNFKIDTRFTPLLVTGEAGFLALKLVFNKASLTREHLRGLGGL